MPKEVERKWLLPEFPAELNTPAMRNTVHGVRIIQAYLVADKDAEVRVRRKNGQGHFLTVKSSGGLVREEIEVKISPEKFSALLPLADGEVIEKYRYPVELSTGQTLEIDQYTGHLAGLVVVECEFPDEESANSFTLPAWVTGAIEVTADSGYKNKNLALRGLPKDFPFRDLLTNA